MQRISTRSLPKNAHKHLLKCGHRYSTHRHTPTRANRIAQKHKLSPQQHHQHQQQHVFPASSATMDAQIESDIVSSKHRVWNESVHTLLHPQPATSAMSNTQLQISVDQLRQLWNDINITISAQIDEIAHHRNRELNFPEISSLIPSIVPAALITDLFALCSQYDDLELFTNIYDFLSYHRVALTNDAVIVIINYLCTHGSSQHHHHQLRNAVLIFNEYLNSFAASQSPTPKLKSVSKREKLRMRRRQQKENSDLSSNYNSDINSDFDSVFDSDFDSDIPNVMLDETGTEPESEWPSLELFNCALYNFSKLRDASLSGTVFERMHTFRLQPNIDSFNALIQTCENIDTAMRIFNQISAGNDATVVPDVHTFNALLSIYYNSAVSSASANSQLQKQHNLDEAVKLFYAMHKQYGMDANADTFAMLFKLCAECQNSQMCLHLLSFMVKHCVESVELSNDVLSALIGCLVQSGEHKLAMRFYEDLFMFRDLSYKKRGDGEDADGETSTKISVSWELSQLNHEFRRRDLAVPNVDIFTHLLRSGLHKKKGIYCDTVLFIQTQMKKYEIAPNVPFYHQLLQIADNCAQNEEIEKLCRLVLKYMLKKKNTTQMQRHHAEQTLQLMMRLLCKYERVDIAVQIYDFGHRELAIMHHWSSVVDNDDGGDGGGGATRRRRHRRRNELRNKTNTKPMTEKQKLLDASAMDAEIACVVIRYVLTSEWPDFKQSMHVKLGGEREKFEQFQQCLDKMFVPPLTKNMTFDETDGTCVIHPDDIKMWILYQAHIGGGMTKCRASS